MANIIAEVKNVWNCSSDLLNIFTPLKYKQTKKEDKCDQENIIVDRLLPGQPTCWFCTIG